MVAKKEPTRWREREGWALTSAGDLPKTSIMGWAEGSAPRRQVLTGPRSQPAGHLTPLIVDLNARRL